MFLLGLTQNILFDLKHSVCLLYVRDGKDAQGGAYLPPFLTQFTFHLEWFLDKSIIWRKKKKKSHHSENVRNASVSKCQENCHAESLFQGNIFLFSRIYRNLLLSFFSLFFFFTFQVSSLSPDVREAAQLPCWKGKDSVIHVTALPRAGCLGAPLHTEPENTGFALCHP